MFVFGISNPLLRCSNRNNLSIVHPGQIEQFGRKIGKTVIDFNITSHQVPNSTHFTFYTGKRQFYRSQT